MDLQVILTSIIGIISAILGFILRMHISKVTELERRVMTLEVQHARFDEKLEIIMEDLREIKTAVTRR